MSEWLPTLSLCSHSFSHLLLWNLNSINQLEWEDLHASCNLPLWDGIVECVCTWVSVWECCSQRECNEEAGSDWCRKGSGKKPGRRKVTVVAMMWQHYTASTESSTVWSVQWHQPSTLNLLSIPHTGLIREAKSPAANLIILRRCVSAAGVGKLCLIESKWVCSTISGRVIQRHRKLVFNQADRLSSFSVTVGVCFAVSLLLE